MKKLLCTLFAILTFLSCYSQKDEKNNLPVIKIENYINKLDQINLSQFSPNIKYIRIQSTESPLSIMHLDCLFSKNLILIKDDSNCYLYDLNGNFLHKVGNRGRGPGEYLLASTTNFARNGNIYLRESYNMIEYSLEGKFINQYKNLLRNGNGGIKDWLQIDDSLFVGYIPNSSGVEDKRLIIFNIKGKVKYGLKNYRILLRKGSLFTYQEQHANLYRFDNQIYIKQVINDTLFTLSSKFKLQPKYVFDFGKYTYQPFLGKPEDLLKYSTDQQNKIWMDNIFQIHDYYFLCCNFNLNFPAKRLTPKVVRNNVTTDYNTTLALGVLNKKTNKLIFCEPTNTDNPLFTSGLFNDIDGGPRFYPMRMIDDSTMVMWIDPKLLKDHIESPEFKNSKPLYPEKKLALIEFVSKISDFDNAVLMLVTF